MKTVLLLLLVPAASMPALGCASVEADRIRAMVHSIAAQEELDPALALAVADVESANGKRQVSDAGAIVVMQLMPGTAEDFGVTDRCDPEQNIRAGIRYLKKLRSEFDDPLLMLAAYNAGPERVYQKGGIPEFEETTQYIAKVMNRWTLNAKAALAQEKRQDHHRFPREKTLALAPSPWRDHHVWNVGDN